MNLLIKISHCIKIAAAMTVLLSLHTGCYRMPNQDEYSVLPTTNNPDVIGKSNASPMPMPGSGF